MENNEFFDWDSVIENDSTFTILPEGEYDFTVTNFTRAEFTPRRADSKIPACKCAELTMTVTDGQGNSVELDDRLFMLRKFEWKLCQFFTSIGQRTSGERLQPRWNEVLGAKGRCKVEIDTYKGSDDKQRQRNRIVEYLPPKAPEAPAAGNFAMFDE